MHQILISAHSHTRWIVIVAAIIAIILPFLNASSGKKARLPGLIFLIVCDVQLLIGLNLYFFYSPSGLQAFENGMSFIMKNGEIRKIAIEHLILMLAAIAMVHIGFSKIKKATQVSQIRKTSLIFYGLALVLIMAGIPWARL